MAQPVYTETTQVDNIVLSDWRVDNGEILATSETVYKAGSVLGKNAAGKLELTTDATKVEAILLGNVDATVADTQGPILIGGAVDEDMLHFGGALTADDVREVLRDKNIYLKKRG